MRGMPTGSGLYPNVLKFGIAHRREMEKLTTQLVSVDDFIGQGLQSFPLVLGVWRHLILVRNAASTSARSGRSGFARNDLRRSKACTFELIDGPQFRAVNALR